MSVKTFIKRKFSAINIGILCLCLIPVVFASFYIFSIYKSNDLIFYIGLYISGVLTFVPLMLLIGFSQLMINPAKYKEHQMKKLRQEREEQRKTYLLIFLYCLWTQSNDLKTNQI
jgi:hypothetical protein